MFIVYNKDDDTTLRNRRDVECFSIVNRGKLWYETLSSEQLQELREWYKAWLDVTETKIVPVEPKWLNNKIEGEEIVW